MLVRWCERPVPGSGQSGGRPQRRDPYDGQPNTSTDHSALRQPGLRGWPRGKYPDGRCPVLPNGVRIPTMKKRSAQILGLLVSVAVLAGGACKRSKTDESATAAAQDVPACV